MLRRIAELFVIVAALVTLTKASTSAEDRVQAERLAMYYRYLDFGSLLKGDSIHPHWMMDGNSFWYAEDGPDNRVFWKVDPKGNSKTSLFDVDRLRKALARWLGHELDGRGVPFPEFSFVDSERAARFSIENRDVVIQLDSY